MTNPASATGQEMQGGAVDATALHTRLLRATAEGAEPTEVRQLIRSAVIDATGANAVAHLGSDQHGHWNFDQLEATGEFPNTPRLADDLSAAATTAIERGTTQIQQLTDSSGHQLVCTPVSATGGQGEVLAAVLGLDVVGLPTALFSLELAGKYQRLWARTNSSSGEQWKLNSLAAIIELVSEVQTGKSIDEAANIAAARSARFLGCSRVAIALSGDRGPRIIAVSGMNTFDPNSETVGSIREAVSECLMRNDVTQWPPGDDQTGQANRAHRIFAERGHFHTVLTAPLVTPQDEQVGAWLFACDADVDQSKLEPFVRTASPRVAAALEATQRGSRGPLTRVREAISNTWKSKQGRAKWFVPALFLGAMLIPFPYRVRCRCIVEPTTRQFAVAPFDGILERGFVQAGDMVEADTLLARMDGREIGLELSGAQAKLGQSGKQRDVDLADGDVSKVLISQLESDRLQSRIDLLRFRRDHLELRSPISGVVLTGDLEKAQSAPVETGQVLYEIGPLDQLRIEIEIPADEVSSINAGQKVKVWLDGLETDAVTGKIDRLRPRSELREDQNVFVAEVLIENSEDKFRPGMRGSARISGAIRPLGWNLFHKPYEFLVSRLTFW